MRIDLHSGPQPSSENSRTQNPAAASGSPAGSALGQDEAQLSGAHVQVQALAAQAAQLPEVRNERVHALRLAVEGGHYHASPEQVAGAMLTHMLAGPAA